MSNVVLSARFCTEKKDEKDIAEDMPGAKGLVRQGQAQKINEALSNFDRGNQFLTGPAHRC
jgi:hypothetical protein